MNICILFLKAIHLAAASLFLDVNLGVVINNLILASSLLKEDVGHAVTVEVQE